MKTPEQENTASSAVNAARHLAEQLDLRKAADRAREDLEKAKTAELKARLARMQGLSEPMTFMRPAESTSEPMDTSGPPSAPDILLEAADCIGDRAAERDNGQERSMARAVRMFNAWRQDSRPNNTGALNEREGWIFMAFLKLARMQGGKYRRDDYVDAAAYLALAAECEERKGGRN